MTDEEKTQLRIRAALAMGAKWYFINASGYRRVRFLLMGDAEKRGYTPAPDDMPMLEDPCARADFDPLENADDCEALLVETIERGWRIERGRRICNDSVSIFFFSLLCEDTGVTHSSDNSDPILAYRESVTLACCAAWVFSASHQSAQEGHTDDLEEKVA